MKDNRLIIIEGPQGTGKTTLANYLRENIKGANLYRLSGQNDKTIKGKKYSIKMYKSLIDYLYKMQDIPMDLIFDRTFMTEEVYARLGYKKYSFTDVYRELVDDLSQLKYDIHYFSVYLENVELFRQRLARESHHNYQAFSLENSVNQQKVYRDISNELALYTPIHVHNIEMDNFDTAYDNVRKILKINR